MKFQKEDISKAFKTTPFEDSLLVFQAEKNAKDYIEFALLSLPSNQLNEQDICQWIDSIDRFKDCYLYEQGNPIRIRLKNSFYPIEFYDNPKINSLTDAFQWLEIKGVEFDVQKPPMFRVIVIEAPIGQIFCLVYHHLLFDGVSVQMALANLDPKYRLPFTDWSPEQRTTQGQTKIDLPAFHLESIVPPPVTPEKRFIYERVKLGNHHYLSVMESWANFIQQASGQDQITIGEVLSARDSNPAASRALGYFVQSWPLHLKGKINAEYLQNERQKLIDKSSSWVNLYFNQNTFDHCWVVEPYLNSNFESAFYSKPHYVLTLVFHPSNDNLELTFCWNLEKIDENAAREITQSFINNLNGIKHQEKSMAAVSFQEENILELWDQMVALYSQETAITDYQGNHLTYSALDQASDDLAQELNIKPDECVGVYASYSCAVPISFLAILKAGGIYVPLDPTVSEDRREFIVQNSNIQCLVSDLESDFGGRIIHPIQQRNPKTFIRPERSAKDTCYLIYTSGTTGEPKGCAVNHINLINLFRGTQSLFSFSPKDRWILAHSYGFDFSTWEIWGALLNGSHLYIPERSSVQDTFKFHQLLINQAITVLNQTPKSFYNLMLVDEDARSLKNIRCVIFGGDKLQTARLNQWIENYPKMNLINMYGITETTVHVTYHKVIPELQSNIGIPLPGYQIALMNSKGKKVPNGFLGEIYVFGNGVCNGYYLNPSLSHEKFGVQENDKYYRSGDLAWFCRQSYYYLGRRDRQVKIRGFRIELGEIEFLLKKLVPACDFIVLFDEEQLIAFHKGDCPTLSPDFFRGKLAEYSIPHQFIMVDKFPLNQSGKIDEKSLLQYLRQNKNQKGETTHCLPIFREMMGEGIDETRTFIQNGGDSIIAIRIINRLKKEGLEISVQDLFSSKALFELVPTIHSNASNKNHLLAYHEKNSLAFSTTHYYFPLLEAQQGILYDCLKSDDQTLYVEQLCYQITSRFTPKEIEKAYALVCMKHPILLARITRINNEYCFEIDQTSSSECMIFEHQTVATIAKQDLERGFDFYNSLSRLTIIPGVETHQVIWTHHHLLLDGWSLGVFSRLMIQALHEKTLASSEAFIQFCAANYSPVSNAYWEKRLFLKNIEPLIPPLPNRNGNDGYQKTNVFVPFQQWEQIQNINLSQHAFMLSAWGAFLSVLFHHNSFSLGNVISLRDDASMDELGMYIRTLPFSIEFAKDDTFSDFSQRTFRLLQDDKEHQHAPINTLIKEAHLNQLFVFENYPVDHKILEDNGVSIGEFNEQTGANWTTLVYPKSDGFEISILHYSSVYSKHYVLQILDHFKNWLQQINWQEPLSKSFEHFSKSPKIVGQSVPLVGTSILNILQRSSSHSAIIGENESLSYQQLWHDAKALSDSLGIQAGEAVGIDVTSTLHFTRSILSIWMANGVPCPVDKRYPKTRKDYVYKNAGVQKILQSNGEILQIETTNNLTIIHPSEAGFILHTSGSTGEPKGVIQTHSCLLNLISWNAKSFQMNDKDVILQLSSFGFDASFHEILLALCLGATLIEMPIEHRLDIHEIRKHIVQYNVSLAWIPARLLNAILEVDNNFFEACHSLRQIVTTGEALVIGQELRYFLRDTNVKLLNYYGPTETHVITANAVDFSKAITQPSIGKILPNSKIHLIQHGMPVPIGMPGEIYAAGSNLALAYLNDEGLTKKNFVEFEGETFYKTGDWAYLDAENCFHFIGRKDDQLKIRGFRVEPLEVEKTLMEINEIKACCVLVHDNSLRAFVVTELSIAKITEKAAFLLPDYMLPSAFYLIDNLPLNTNGKADRALLKGMIVHEVSSAESLDHTLESVRCWKEILGHSNFGPNDAFELVGGNSILLMKMQAWLEKNCDCFISMRSLLTNNTPNRLEIILEENRKQKPFILPPEFELNALQKEILISEKGNHWGTQSPFVLRFQVQLKQELSKDNFERAIEELCLVFPNIAYVIDQSENLEKATWISLEESRALLFQDSPLNFDTPLIRFVHHNTKHLEFIYHHILIDGLGMSILLNTLIGILSGSKPQRRPPLQTLLSFSPKFPKLSIATQSLPVKINRYSIEGSTLNQIHDYCKTKGITHSEFFYLTACYAHKTCWVAAADVQNHPGIPGMFTELKAIEIDRNHEIILKNSVNTPPLMNVVCNYMNTNLPSDWVDSLKTSQPLFTKYPFEWQFLATNNQTDVYFYSGSDCNEATEIFNTWKTGINLRLEGKMPSLNTEDEWADDFDF